MCVPSYLMRKLSDKKSDSMVPGSIDFNLLKINIEQMLYNSDKTTFDSRKMYGPE